jgi:antitoxin CptB
MSVLPMARDDARLRWKCRRGMKELDVVLERYFDHRYSHADENEKRAFTQLLELQDPVIFGYLMGRATPGDPSIANVITWLRNPSQYLEQ